MFNATGESLRAKEIPPRLRRYILLQTEKYRYQNSVMSVDFRNGEEIVHIRRGRKIGGGERRRNQGPSKTKIGR